MIKFMSHKIMWSDTHNYAGQLAQKLLQIPAHRWEIDLKRSAGRLTSGC